MPFIKAELETPTVPNFIRIKNPGGTTQTVALDKLSKSEINAIARDWKKDLLAKWQEKCDAVAEKAAKNESTSNASR